MWPRGAKSKSVEMVHSIRSSARFSCWSVSGPARIIVSSSTTRALDARSAMASPPLRFGQRAVPSSVML